MWQYCSENAHEMAKLSFHASMVMFTISYALRDILWLRGLAVVAGLLGLPYFFLCVAEFQWEPVFWNSLFTVIHAVRLTMLLYERRPVELGEDAQRLHMLCFRGLQPRELLRLLSVGEWRTAEAGEQLVRKGDALDGLIILFSGTVDVSSNGRVFASSRDGQCIGEMSFLTGMPTSADVYARTALRYVFWRKDKLTELTDRDDHIREVVQSVIGFDMAEKLAARSELDTRTSSSAEVNEPV